MRCYWVNCECALVFRRAFNHCAFSAKVTPTLGVDEGGGIAKVFVKRTRVGPSKNNYVTPLARVRQHILRKIRRIILPALLCLFCQGHHHARVD